MPAAELGARIFGELNQLTTGRIVLPFTDGIEFVNAVMRRLDRKMPAASPTMITYEVEILEVAS